MAIPTLLQAFGIGYRAVHPEAVVRVHSDEPRPILRLKPDPSSSFRRYNFVSAVLALDPVRKLGLTASDYQVLCCSIMPLVICLFF